jgi:hypothetical protein
MKFLNNMEEKHEIFPIRGSWIYKKVNSSSMSPFFLVTLESWCSRCKLSITTFFFFFQYCGLNSWPIGNALSTWAMSPSPLPSPFAFVSQIGSLVNFVWVPRTWSSTFQEVGQEMMSCLVLSIISQSLPSSSKLSSSNQDVLDIPASGIQCLELGTTCFQIKYYLKAPLVSSHKTVSSWRVGTAVLLPC